MEVEEPLPTMRAGQVDGLHNVYRQDGAIMTILTSDGVYHGAPAHHGRGNAFRLETACGLRVPIVALHRQALRGPR